MGDFDILAVSIFGSFFGRLASTGWEGLFWPLFGSFFWVHFERGFRRYFGRAKVYEIGNIPFIGPLILGVHFGPILGSILALFWPDFGGPKKGRFWGPFLAHFWRFLADFESDFFFTFFHIFYFLSPFWIPLFHFFFEFF